jgi:hypothetical protein
MRTFDLIIWLKWALSESPANRAVLLAGLPIIKEAAYFLRQKSARLQSLGNLLQPAVINKSTSVTRLPSTIITLIIT